MSDFILQCENIVKTYQLGEVKIHALEGVSVDVREKEFSALVGPSGSGKSTLLHIAAGIDKPDSGVIKIDGEDISSLDDNSLSIIRNQKIGFIFQTFNLIPVLSVYENVEYPCLVFPSQRKNRKNVDELLDAVGMLDKKDKRPNQLSGGERQRVAIARALINQPKIVFADEPTANLDHTTGEKIMSVMKDLNERYGTTLVFTTHDPYIMKKATRVINIFDGQIKKEG